MFKKISSKTVYKNKRMIVFEDKIEYKNGEKGTYTYFKRRNGVLVLVWSLDTRKVLLIQQYRYPIQKVQWTIPGGAIDDDELPEMAAKREVFEETGLEISKLEKIGVFFPMSSCALESETLFLSFVKFGLSSKKGQLYDEEIMKTKFITINKAIEMMDRGEISDAMTSLAIQMLDRRMGNK